MTEELFRLIGAALLGILCVMLLRRGNPELAFLAGAATTALLLHQLILWLRTIREEASFLTLASPYGQTLAETLVKIAFASVASRLGAETARDAGQNALAYAVELLGTASSLILALPVLKRIFEAAVGCFS